MTQSKHGWVWHSALTTFLAIFRAIGTEAMFLTLAEGVLAQSQIEPDNTLGSENSVVIPNANGLPVEEIHGGAVRGSNLFHSFREFNVNAGRGAYFINPRGIDNILSRVTGTNTSQILGTLGVIGNANLFFINPNGIIFGANARLDLGGSFLATTASSPIFADGTQFSATDPESSPLLTVSIPVGLQFGETSGSIINQSIAADSDRFPAGLQIQPGKTLALVGGKIEMQGGLLTGFNGRIELGSVAGTGRVSLQSIKEGWLLNYENAPNFQDIKITQAPQAFEEFGIIIVPSIVNAEGSDIQLHGRNIILTDGSQIVGTGGNMTVTASETVKLDGIGSLRNNFSGLVGATGSEGDAGNITINAQRLILQGGGRITTESAGVRVSGEFTPATGQGGDLIVNASESVVLDGSSALLSKTLGTGMAGDITINTGTLIIRDGAEVDATSQGSGNAGNINITANSIFLNEGNITAETRGNPSQTGANINLQVSDLLLLQNDSLISATAFNEANGGNINIDTKYLIALPSKGFDGNDIIANAFRGNGGNINITAQRLFGIESRSQLTQFNDITASSEFGTNGVIEINTPEFEPAREELPSNLVDVSRIIEQNLCQAGRGSQFTVTGRGGLPNSPNEAFSSYETWEDWRVAEASQQPVTLQPTINRQQAIVEAQGWVVNSQGKVVLTAEPIATVPHTPILTQSGCR